MKQHQHYVPEPYLTNFTKNRKGRLVVYKRDGTHIKGKAKDFCGENEFYSFVDSSGNLDRSIEEMLAVIDDAGATSIRTLLANEDPSKLTEKEREELAIFFSFLLVRDRRYREEMKNMTDIATRVMFRAAASTESSFKNIFGDYEEELSDSDLREIRETILSDAYEMEYTKVHWLKLTLEMALAVLPHVLGKRYWTVTGVHYPDEVIITSDSPATVLQPPDSSGSLGVGVANGILYLPLSCRSCLFLHNEQSALDFLLQRGVKHVAYLNHHQLFNAYRYVFSEFLIADVSSAFMKTSQENCHRVVARGPSDLIPPGYRANH
jgi:hypothetical protein